MVTVSGSLLQPLQAVREELRIVLQHAQLLPESLLDDLLTKNDRHLHGCLVLLAGEAAGAQQNTLMPAALSMELLALGKHMHDLGSRFPTRRSSLFDPVLVGDFLYSQSFSLASELPHVVIQGVSKVFQHWTLQRVRPLQHLRTSAATEWDYLEDAYSKSALLLATSGQTGAALGRSSAKVTEAMTAFGYWLGMALQIQDDVLRLPHRRVQQLLCADPYFAKARSSLSALPASPAKTALLDLLYILNEQAKKRVMIDVSNS